MTTRQINNRIAKLRKELRETLDVTRYNEIRSEIETLKLDLAFMAEARQ